MDTLTLAYIGLVSAGGLAYWLYYWLGSGQPFIFRKAVKSWLTTIALSAGAYFGGAALAGPLTLLSAFGAVELGIRVAQGADWANAKLAGPSVSPKP